MTYTEVTLKRNTVNLTSEGTFKVNFVNRKRYLKEVYLNIIADGTVFPMMK
jgi:hypothetical protein